MIKSYHIETKELAKIVDGEHFGSNNTISGINSIDLAGENQLTFLSDAKYKHYLEDTKAGCILVDKKFDTDEYPKVSFIKVDNPHFRFARFLIYLAENYVSLDITIHDTSVIDSSSSLGNNVNIGAHSVIGKNCVISDNVYIYPNVTIYDNVKIDTGTIIHSNSVICDDTEIGSNCLILPGAVIGSDGFGFLDNPDGSYTRIPQMGKVIIEDNVEIGSNTTIDRALAGTTHISKGVKLDNLIQIAHNVKIGENTAMASQTGVSGTSNIGKRNRFGGQVGIAGHLSTADDVIIMAQSGVAKSVDKPGAYFGTPVRDRLTAFKINAILGSLPELVVQIHQLKKKLNL